MIELDFDKPYGTIHGTEKYRYVQNGRYYDSLGQFVPDLPALPRPREEVLIETDSVDSAREFLKNILKENPLPKSRVYAESQNNNQDWEAVNTARKLLKVKSFQVQNVEMWKLVTE